MLKARRKRPLVLEQDIDITQFSGLNSFGPHADLKKSEQRQLDNYDNYGTYIKSRRGSELFIADPCATGDVLSHVVVDAGADEYLIIQQLIGVGLGSKYRYVKLATGELWKDVLIKTTGLAYTSVLQEDKADMFFSNGKIYIFQEAGNALLEFNVDTLVFEQRKMGLPAPQIESISFDVGDLKGKRVYGLELVYKDTSITPEVPILVSGVNRALSMANALQAEGALAFTDDIADAKFVIRVSPTMNDGSGITDDENDNWTHIRLWRTKDLTTATNTTVDFNSESEITGRPDELYIVQEYTRDDFIDLFDAGNNNYILTADNTLDDAMPFPLDVVTKTRLELVPIPSAKTGVYQNNRIWVSGVVQLPGSSGLINTPNAESKIYYTPDSNTIYSENMNVLSAIESDPGDGQKMIKLINFRNDLIGIKEGKTGRVRNADPLLGWTTEDVTTGVSFKEYAQFVPGVGICAIVNDQKDFKIFGFDLQWSSTFAGQQISRPIRDDIKSFTPEDIDFFYINGKLIINGGKGVMLVLATEQQSGWSKYLYNTQDVTEVAFIFAEGTRAGVVSGGQVLVEIEKEDSNGDFVNTDYNTSTALDVPIDLQLDTWKFQDKEGRSLVEERFISIVAQATTALKATAFVNGKFWQPQFPLLLDPADYPELALRETEYQGYQQYRAVGNYINYLIQTSAPCTIYSITLNALVQRGSIRPGFDPFQVLAGATVIPAWAGVANSITETGFSGSDTITETGLSSDDTITEISQ